VTRDVSTVILDALAEVGVTHIFGLPGDAINGLVDATRRHASIEFVTVRHEEAGHSPPAPKPS
jgi:pyruvate dehydrogenase (quinone)